MAPFIRRGSAGMLNSVPASLAASGHSESTRFPKLTWSALQVATPSPTAGLVARPLGRVTLMSRIWAGSSTSTPLDAGRRIVTSSPVGEDVWRLVGSTVKPGPKGKLLQPVIVGKAAFTSLPSGKSCSTQLEALTPIASGTPQRVGLVMKGNGSEPGGRGGETVQ